MGSYRLRAHARNDLEVIWDYTLEQWGVQQAERYFEALFTCFDDLAANPQMGRQRDEVFPGIRGFPQGRHIVFYELDEAGIEIVGIVHQSADVDAYSGNL
jgi:toxin ParE1/3/4